VKAEPEQLERPRHPTSAGPLQPIDTAEAQNLVALALYQILLRVGWIFKTESIIIPAFLDTIAGAGWLRGCLPALNRFGQSVPPVLATRYVARMPRKKWALLGFTLPMALACLILALLCAVHGGRAVTWLPAAFLVLYAVFFAATGCSQLAYGTLQGKLVPARMRGRLMSASSSIAAPAAILLAWSLMGDWLARPDRGFQLIFGFAGACFVLSACSALILIEKPDRAEVANARDPGSALAALRGDGNLRQLALVTALFATVLILFPHYQAMARERLGLGTEHLIAWVIVQNIGTAVFSAIAGPIGDYFGQRLALRLLVFGAALVPIAATVLALADVELGRHAFPGVFFLVGMTPVTLKTLNNYTLEVSPPEHHARYLSTMNLVLAAPFFISPLVGYAIDRIGFESVMIAGSVVIVAAGMFSLGLSEPRRMAPIGPGAGPSVEQSADPGIDAIGAE